MSDVGNEGAGDGAVVVGVDGSDGSRAARRSPAAVPWTVAVARRAGTPTEES